MMEPLEKTAGQLVPKDSQWCTPQSTSFGAEKMALAAAAAEQMLKGRPDFGNEPPGYLMSLTETLAHYDAATLRALVHPVNGVPGRCKFLPTPADIAECAREIEAKRNQFRPAHTAYHKFTPENPVSETEARTECEHRREVVKMILPDGNIRYPGDKSGLDLLDEILVKSESELTEREKSILKANGPNAPWRIPRPPSKELLQLIAEEAEAWEIEQKAIKA